MNEDEIYPEKSVVIVNTDRIQTDWTSPWIRSSVPRSTGSGFCISANIEEILGNNKKTYKKGVNVNKYIVTNAHCVDDSSYISLRKHGSSIYYKAYIEFILYECDLALLSLVESVKTKDRINEFWDDIPPLSIGGIPNRSEKVRVMGYPLRGDNVSITKGIVNRVITVPYWQNMISGLAIQIDAAINYGNSGGPVLNKNNEVIGIAFSGEDFKETESVGYIIPTTMLKFFINSIKKKSFMGENRQFMGLCVLNIEFQKLYNSTLREYLGMTPVDTGVMVSHVSPNQPLKNGDIIIKINGKNVNNDGNILLKDIVSDIDPENENNSLLGDDDYLSFNNLISMKYPGDNLHMTIWRNNNMKKVTIVLKPNNFISASPKARYLFVVGMVFVPLSRFLVNQLYHNDRYIVSLEELLMNPIDGIEPVVLTNIFTSDITDDFPNDNYVLNTLNGVTIKNLEHLSKMINGIKKGFLEFAFRDTSKIAVIKAVDIKKYSKILMKDYGIPLS